LADTRDDVGEVTRSALRAALPATGSVVSYARADLELCRPSTQDASSTRGLALEGLVQAVVPDVVAEAIRDASSAMAVLRPGFAVAPPREPQLDVTTSIVELFDVKAKKHPRAASRAALLRDCENSLRELGALFDTLCMIGCDEEESG
jgi:hypothetical protein